MTHSAKLHIDSLKRMDDFMRNLSDEEYVMWWLEDGVPDGEFDEGWTYEDTEWLVDCYDDICKAFMRILNEYVKEYGDLI